jgi:hypothetical protein
MYQDGSFITSKNHGATKLWGFRFMYNPETISISGDSRSTPNDWTMGKADPSTSLGGTLTVSVRLLLNRMVDMNWLASGQPGGYPAGTQLSKEDMIGIQTRGTEYDLEYLYRVMNGEPLKNQALLKSGQPTSDFGYFTGMPFWLHMHDNMRYRVGMSNIGINHIVFTEQMIPVLTEVSVDLLRIPALETMKLTKKEKQAQVAYLAAINTTVGGIGK